jgi:hypothetical protein
MSPNAGVGSDNEYICAHGAQKNFEDLTPYLTYGFADPTKSWNADPNLEESKNAA